MTTKIFSQTRARLTEDDKEYSPMIDSATGNVYSHETRTLVAFVETHADGITIIGLDGKEYGPHQDEGDALEDFHLYSSLFD